MVPVARLVRHLTRGPHRYDPERVEQLAVALDERLAPRSGGSSSLVRPNPLSWPDPPPRRPGRPGPISTRPSGVVDGFRPVLRNARRRRAGRRQRAPERDAAAGGCGRPGAVLLLLCGLEPGASAGDHVGGLGGIVRLGCVHAAGIVAVVVVLPGRDRGWTVTLAWPVGAPSRALDGRGVLVSRWALDDQGDRPGSRQPTLTGLGPDTEWVRVATSFWAHDLVPDHEGATGGARRVLTAGARPVAVKAAAGARRRGCAYRSGRSVNSSGCARSLALAASGPRRPARAGSAFRASGSGPGSAIRCPGRTASWAHRSSAGR